MMLRILALREARAAVVRVGFEHDARGALPFLEPIGARADWLAADIVARRLDDLARDRHGRQARQALKQRIIDARHPYLQGVAVDGPQPRDRSVVIESPTRLARGIDDWAGAFDQVGKLGIAADQQIRIDRALDR